MGVQAYILIQTEVGKAGDVADQVRELDGVTEADDVTGPYDVMAKAEAETDGRAGPHGGHQGADDRPASPAR